jgi:VWFA-related protein
MLALAAPGGGHSQATGPAPEDRPDPTYEESIEVSLRTCAVRVLDVGGKPILGLRPEDFRADVARRRIPVLAVEWVGPGAALSVPAMADAVAAETPPGRFEIAPAAQEAGRLVVVFVQADMNPTRVSGQMRLRPYTRELLDTLHPSDRVAVVSFDSHLKLWQDFDTDLEATHRAIDVAFRYSPEVVVAAARPHSLARHFDPEAARRAASPERALELVGRALEALPGQKTLIFLGWGLGRFGVDGVRMTPNYDPAVRALRDARAAVFVLDVTSADEHSLAVGLEGVADDTGGLYLSTFQQPGVATRILAEAISGYYVLTFDAADVGEREDDLRVRLERRHIGRVLRLSDTGR